MSAATGPPLAVLGGGGLDRENEPLVANGREPCDFAEGKAPIRTVQEGGPDCGPIESPPRSLRARVIAELSARVGEAAAAGDVSLARVLGRALVELLGEKAEGDIAEVVDLASKSRGRRNAPE